MARAPKSTIYTVRGTAPFPWDMLRYDGASPTDNGVQAFMHRESLVTHGRPRGANDPLLNAAYAAWREEMRAPFEVELRCDGSPEIDRWRSFGWAVKIEHTY